jgi:metal-dependent HD superfamily phosphatase/phosphodiesterase
MNTDHVLEREKLSVRALLEPNTKSLELYQYLKGSPKVQSYLKSANRMAVSRLGYTDHGHVHAEVATWNALRVFDILDETFMPNVVAEGIGDSDDARLVVLASTYLHDLGMVIHRKEHYQAAIQLAAPILEEKLDHIYDNPGKSADILSTILHGIYSHDDDIQCLTLEAGITKIGDGCDMTRGRTMVPYHQGKVDIHSVSAMAIRDVILERGEEKPLRISVAMDNPAGVFQVEAVLVKKIGTTGLKDHIDVNVLVNGERLELSQVVRLHRDHIGDIPDHPVSRMSNSGE